MDVCIDPLHSFISHFSLSPLILTKALWSVLDKYYPDWQLKSLRPADGGRGCSPKPCSRLQRIWTQTQVASLRVTYPFDLSRANYYHYRRYRKLVRWHWTDKADRVTGGKESLFGGLAWSLNILNGFIFFGQLSPFLCLFLRRMLKRTLLWHQAWGTFR